MWNSVFVFVCAGPPAVDLGWDAAPSGRRPGTPDTRSRAACSGSGGTRWHARARRAFGIVWMVAQALMPFAIGRAIQEGIVDDDSRALVFWALHPARPRRRAGRRRRHAPPLRRAPTGCRRRSGSPRSSATTPRAPAPPCVRSISTGRGRRDGLERRDARGRRVRHHRAPRRRSRRVLRRRGDPAVGLGRARSRRAARRADARRHARRR